MRAMRLPIEPLGVHSASAAPSSPATRSSSFLHRRISRSRTSSPTSAAAMAVRICFVGWVTVSERRSIGPSWEARAPGPWCWVARRLIQPVGDGPGRAEGHGMITTLRRSGEHVGGVQPCHGGSSIPGASAGVATREGSRWTRPRAAGVRGVSRATPCGARRSCCAATGTAPTTTPRPRSSRCTAIGAGSGTGTRSTPGCARTLVRCGGRRDPAAVAPGAVHGRARRRPAGRRCSTRRRTPSPPGTCWSTGCARCRHASVRCWCCATWRGSTSPGTAAALGCGEARQEPDLARARRPCARCSADALDDLRPAGLGAGVKEGDMTGENGDEDRLGGAVPRRRVDGARAAAGLRPRRMCRHLAADHGAPPFGTDGGAVALLDGGGRGSVVALPRGESATVSAAAPRSAPPTERPTAPAARPRRRRSARPVRVARGPAGGRAWAWVAAVRVMAPAQVGQVRGRVQATRAVVGWARARVARDRAAGAAARARAARVRVARERAARVQVARRLGRGRTGRTARAGHDDVRGPPGPGAARAPRPGAAGGGERQGGGDDRRLPARRPALREP